MKPITNILLILALVCYVFLPFLEISFQGSQSGLAHTAGLITQDFSVGKTLYALLPFISCFAAIGVNGLKNRYWGLLVMVIIAFGLGFLLDSNDVHQQLALTHDPELMADASIAQGFEVTGLGIGYQSCLVLTVMAMVSAFLSILPFKFNLVLERQIDHGFEEGKKHLSEIGSRVSSDIHNEIDRLEEKSHIKKRKPSSAQQQTASEAGRQPAERADKGNDADYMPPEMREAAPEATATTNQASSQPKATVIVGIKVSDSETDDNYKPQADATESHAAASSSDDDKYKAYMPKSDDGDN